MSNEDVDPIVPDPAPTWDECADAGMANVGLNDKPPGAPHPIIDITDDGDMAPYQLISFPFMLPPKVEPDEDGAPTMDENCDPAPLLPLPPFPAMTLQITATNNLHQRSK